MANEEVKLYIPEHIVRELEAAAEDNPGYTRNEVAIDVIRQCLPIWLVARRAFAGTLDDFLRQMTEQAQARLNQQSRR